MANQKPDEFEALLAEIETALPLTSRHMRGLLDRLLPEARRLEAELRLFDGMLADRDVALSRIAEAAGGIRYDDEGAMRTADLVEQRLADARAMLRDAERPSLLWWALDHMAYAMPAESEIVIQKRDECPPVYLLGRIGSKPGREVVFNPGGDLTLEDAIVRCAGQATDANNQRSAGLSVIAAALAAAQPPTDD